MDMARRLEMVLGPSAQFWCKLEAFYREDLAKALEENAMEEDIAIAKKLPYKEMAGLGWVEDQTAWSEKVISLRKFFEVAQLSLLQEKLLPAVACRKLSDTEKSDLALLTWAQKAKLEARQIETRALKVDGIVIPPEAYEAFVSAGDFGKSAICRFADGVGIDAGIVVGRLQKDGHISFSRFHELKTKYEITA